MSVWLPGCTKQSWGTDGGSWARQPALIVLHTTEGTSWPGYDSGQSAPHFTIHPGTGERRQHIGMDRAARALANASGGAETNRAGAIQVEIIGTCDPSRRGQSGWMFVPDADMSHVAALVHDIADDRGIPLTSSVTWKAYPGSYGTGNGVRLSSSAWSSYRGVCGHQHVPENDHGDPGNINISAILSGDEMTDDDVRRIWAYATTNARTGEATTTLNTVRYAQSEASMTHTDTGVLRNDVDALAARLEDVAALLGKVADELGVQP